MDQDIMIPRVIEVDGLPAISFIALVKDQQNEAFERLFFLGLKRLYLEDLTQRDYSLETTTPYQFEILGKVFTDRAWGNLLYKVADCLLEAFPAYLDTILDFRCPWSKQAMFSTEKRTNYKLVRDGLYINVNHTALHSCWMLQDLLDYFQIDKSSVRLLIHRPSGAESEPVKDYIRMRFKDLFTKFLMEKYGKEQEYAEKKVIPVIEKYLNPMLKKTSKSYIDFFLFGDNQSFVNYMVRVKQMVESDPRFNDKQKKALCKYLDYLHTFYKVQFR